MLTAKQFMESADPSALCGHFLGEGCYATVYAVPGDDFRAIKRGGRLEDGWLSYALWCMENKGKYRAALRVDALRIDGDGYWALMERADRTCCDADGEDYGPTFHKALASRNVNDVRRAVNASDIHDENIMIRRNGTFVVVDPIAETSEEGNLNDARRVSTKTPKRVRVAI